MTDVDFTEDEPEQDLWCTCHHGSHITCAQRLTVPARSATTTDFKGASPMRCFRRLIARIIARTPRDLTAVIAPYLPTGS